MPTYADRLRELAKMLDDDWKLNKDEVSKDLHRISVELRS